MSTTVWTVIQHREGKVHRMSLEAIAASQQLADALGGRAAAVVLAADPGAVAEQVAAYDLEAVHVAEHPAFTHYDPGAYVAALAPAIAAARPALVVFPHTYQSVDYFPRLGHAADAAVVPEIIAFEATDGGFVWKRPIMTGKLQAKVRVRGESTILVSVQSAAFAADSARPGAAPVQPLDVDLSAVRAEREHLGVEAAGSGDQVDLTKADVIVAAGRGVGGEDKLGPLRELARALGGEIGASRPVIDSGWLERERQIGSSGQTVAPKLYLAVGISGAIQHLVGMKGSGCVVAINKDASAPIFSIADYGIVGDLHDIVPALTEAVKEAKAG
jgi:electron transfer flavoprotein alpha subunit